MIILSTLEVLISLSGSKRLIRAVLGCEQTKYLSCREEGFTAQLSQLGGTNRIKSDETNAEVLQRIISFSDCVRMSGFTAVSLR